MNKLNEMSLEELIKFHEELKEHRIIFGTINPEFYFEFVDNLINYIKRQDCVIETQAHNEEVLMEYFNRHACLHCGEGKPGYCEECYQKLIAENMKLQTKEK